MQPPPRKVKPAVQLKNNHAEQLNKLQAKHQQEYDLLEDIRNFSKQRSTIEKDYAQALSKLANQYLSKSKDWPPSPDISSDDGKDHKTAHSVWRTVLEQTDTVAKQRLEHAETILQSIHEPVKQVRTNKGQQAKKVFDQVKVLQNEISQTVNEMVKSQTEYSKEEHLAHDARVKASEAEQKLKKRSIGLFSSMASLQKNTAKLTARKDACEVKSTSARNDYLLNMAAANAQHIRHSSTDLPELIQNLDGETFDRIRDYFLVLGTLEVQSCGVTQECFSRVLLESGMISQTYNLQCFLHNNFVFTNLVQYKFEPCDNDQVTGISTDHNAREQVESEAKKWATKVAKESKAIRDYTRKYNALQASINNSGNKKRAPSESSSGDGKEKDKNEVDPETRLEELKQYIRRAETARMKAEGRLDLLRIAGINVDEWLSVAQADHESHADDLDEDVTSRHSMHSQHSSGGSAEDHSSTPTKISQPAADISYHNYQEDDLEYIDDTYAGESTGTTHNAYTGSRLGQVYPVQCLALYEFQGSNQDELTFAENEQLELIADGDGDGWVKGRNSNGVEGFIPENYVQILDGSVSEAVIPNNIDHATDQANSATDDATYLANSVDQPTSISSLQSGHQGETAPIAIATDLSQDGRASYSSNDYEVEQVNDGQQVVDDGMWARALYDYEACTTEELSFIEGQLIKVLRKEEKGTDDGWWKGEVEGKVGVFPSLVVEEITNNDNDQELHSPEGTCPPNFAPPPPAMAPPGLTPTYAPEDVSQPSNEAITRQTGKNLF
ncbi:unnamed protein product [Owenia fusiformis]|uniref:FCH and double SH3 domains protein 2 n=1 Tax=Owenia fusiformis TaxID=6347 RepID=A0A8S4N615_OWEFU|nr:unnamed protein product [Owenia fusiformis]